jgi:patatin-like phospholipase/acyl hydrolase
LKPYLVLSLDGGGIRGVLTAVLLERLDRAVPFLDRVDLFAGTSTGGIIALALAFGYPPGEVRTFYENLGARIFEDTFLDDVRDLGNLVGAEYSIDNLAQALGERFEGKRLGDLTRNVVVSSFDLDNAPVKPGQARTWKAKFFHNFPGPDSDASERIDEVALRTSAAPTFFPIFQGYIDGGVVASNPAMCALAQALNKGTGGQELDQVLLLSMGTGRNPRFLTSVDGDWGLAQWAPHLVDLILEGSVNLANYQCRQVLGDRYLRIDPLLDERIGLDGVDQIGSLVAIANQVDLTQAVLWLQRFFPSLS